MIDLIHELHRVARGSYGKVAISDLAEMSYKRIAELERELQAAIDELIDDRPRARAEERERYKEVLTDYRETLEEMGYSDTRCDCDPSVGITSCCWCRLRALMAQDLIDEVKE